MKRFFCFFLSLTLLCVPLSSCSKSAPDAVSLLLSLLSIIEESASPAVLYSDNGAEETEKMSAEDFGRLYTGKWQSPACFSEISSFAVRLPVDDSGFEIHIAVTSNRSDTESVVSLFSARIDKLKNDEIKKYAPESYLKYYENAEIFVRGRYVFLLAAPVNAALIAKIKRLT